MPLAFAMADSSRCIFCGLSNPVKARLGKCLWHLLWLIALAAFIVV